MKMCTFCRSKGQVDSYSMLTYDSPAGGTAAVHRCGTRWQVDAVQYMSPKRYGNTDEDVVLWCTTGRACQTRS